MLPIKINTDLDPAVVPQNSSKLNLNVNFDILKGAIVNEQGFDIIPLTNDNRLIVGSCVTPSNRLVLFSIINGQSDYSCEIGILGNNQYSVILKDNKSVDALFNFSTTNLIQCEAKVNFKGDEIIYFVDGLNSDKWLNLDDLQVTVTSDLRISSQSELSLLSNFLPTIGDIPDNTTSVVSGGNLSTGVYYIAIVYGDKFKNFTKTLLLSNPVPVTTSNAPYNTNFIGDKAGETSNKAIQINVPVADLNTQYDYLKVFVISKINQVVKGYNFGIFDLPNTDFTCVIDTLLDKEEVSVDSIIINNADYKSSLTLTQLDDVLYKANLRTRETIDLQPYVNNIVTNYVQKQINTKNQTPGSNFKDANLCFYSKSFTYDETYAFYISFIIDDGDGEYETKAYHIPGRRPVEINLGGISNPNENDLIEDVIADSNLFSSDYYNTGTLTDMTPLAIFKNISSDAKVFHAIPTNNNPLAPTNMGYWENKDEIYSNNGSWIVKDANGTQVDSFEGENVRHHKFPEPFSNVQNRRLHPNNTDYNIVNVLGIQLSNLVIPVELQNKVKKVNLYYAKRSLNNRTIIGESLLESLYGFSIQDPNGAANFGSDRYILNGLGNFLHFNGTVQGQQDFGLVPLGYELTNAQQLDSWYYADQSFTPFDDSNSGFFKFKAFDILQQTLDVNSAVYLKNQFRIKSKYKGKILQGNLGDENTASSVGFLFDPGNYGTDVIASDYYGGVDRTVDSGYSPFINLYRPITKINYVAQNFPNQREVTSNSPYPFSMIPYNYQGEQSVWIQTSQRLYSYDLSATGFHNPGQDTGGVSYADNIDFQNYNNTGIYASPYISDLCVFRLNLFTGFDNQILCLANSNDILDGTFYGGDTFISIYGERSTLNTTNWTPKGTPISYPDSFKSTIHAYICQSTSNINYRYKGDNLWETFFPLANENEMWSLPVINPEWFGYNIDYSSVNDIKQPVISPNNFNQFQTIFPNRVIRSAKDNPEIIQDNYLDYQAGDYKDFGKIKGQIRNITNQNNKLLIKTDNALYATLGREVISTENAEANVTAGDIFAVKPREIVSSDSYGGGLGRFADVVTQYGYFYPDTTNGIVYNFDGNGIDEISKAGQQIFFRNELKFKLPQVIDSALFNSLPVYVAGTYLIDFFVTYNGKVWKSTKNGSLAIPGTNNDWIEVDYTFNRIDSIIDTQSIGVQAAFDYKYRRYILTKKDYNFIGYPVSFIGNLPDNVYQNDGKIVWFNGTYYKIYSVPTANLAPPNSTLLSTRIYNDGVINVPYLVYGVEVNFETDFNMVPNRFTVAYYPESQAWISFYDYYPDYLTYSLDKVYSFSRTNLKSLFRHNSDLHNSFYYNRLVPYESFVEPILNEPKGCRLTSSFSIKSDAFRKDNTLDYLQSFSKYFVRNSYQISQEESFINTETSRNAEGYFNINTFRDFTKNNSEPLMTTGIINYPNGTNINPNKHWSKQKRFVDYYIIPRLTYNTAFETVNTSLSHTAGTNFLVTSAIFELGDIIKFTVGPTTYTYIITNPTNKIYVPISETEAGNFTVNSFLKAKTRQLNLLDINRLEHKNNR